MAPPIIIAATPVFLTTRKPKSPAAIGIINAPENNVKAISKELMIDVIFNAKTIAAIPKMSINMRVFLVENFSSSFLRFSIGSLNIVELVSNVVDADDSTAERNAAITNPETHGGKYLSIAVISEIVFELSIFGNK